MINSTWFPLYSTTVWEIQALSSGKAAVSDAMPAEVYNYGVISLAHQLTKSFDNTCSNRSILQEYKDASILHLYKKDNTVICNNHCTISLLVIAGAKSLLGYYWTASSSSSWTYFCLIVSVDLGRVMVRPISYLLLISCMRQARSARTLHRSYFDFVDLPTDTYNFPDTT